MGLVSAFVSDSDFYYICWRQIDVALETKNWFVRLPCRDKSQKSATFRMCNVIATNYVAIEHGN